MYIYIYIKLYFIRACICLVTMLECEVYTIASRHDNNKELVCKVTWRGQIFQQTLSLNVTCKYNWIYVCSRKTYVCVFDLVDVNYLYVHKIQYS